MLECEENLKIKCQNIYVYHKWIHVNVIANTDAATYMMELALHGAYL
jgi:hypothetical protein